MNRSLSLVVVALLCAIVAHSQEPVVAIRADSLVQLDTEGRVASWTSVVGSAAFMADTNFVNPLFVRNGINGKPTLRFANDGYLEGPALFPTFSDYTLYVVMHWAGGNASNNIVSGASHALYMGNSPYVRLLHSGNFGQQAVSPIGVDGPTVIRVTFSQTTHLAQIALNNVHAVEAPVPDNIDPTIFIGSYARGNFFWGDISEVLIYDQLLDSAMQYSVESEIHERYNIYRAPDPLPPVVLWDVAPAPRHFVPLGEYLSLRGTILDQATERITVTLDSNGITVYEWLIEAGQPIEIDRPVFAGLHQYHLQAQATMADGSTRTVLNADQIVCGIAFAIEGQSNSIFGDATQTPSPYARTYGSNFGKVPSDTLFKGSIATGNGGGANVGAWGLRLQNQIAVEQRMPTCVINGGVGGTTIQSHFPNENDRMNLNSIYGSWLYRLEKSGLREHIRWLFWYQGESNSGSDDYLSLFTTLREAWLADLPNLEHIVVVQIRPGCGGTEHGRLRDDQRRLQEVFSDVMVHTACALPGHDGCHFQSSGYRMLGDQLYRLYRDTEAGIDVSDARAPCIHRVRQDVATGDVTITVQYADALSVVNADGRPLKSAFFFDEDEAKQPDSAWIVGSTIVLRPPSSATVSTVSYVPDKNVGSTTLLYPGPWLVDETGVGMLTFHNVPVLASGVNEDHAEQAQKSILVYQGDRVPLIQPGGTASLMDIEGRRYTINTSGNAWLVDERVAPGVYLLVERGDGLPCLRTIMVAAH